MPHTVIPQEQQFQESVDLKENSLSQDRMHTPEAEARRECQTAGESQESSESQTSQEWEEVTETSPEASSDWAEVSKDTLISEVPAEALESSGALESLEASSQAIYEKLVMEGKTLRIIFETHREFENLRTSLVKKFQSTRKIFDEAGLDDPNEANYLSASWNPEEKSGIFRVTDKSEKSGGKTYRIEEL